MSTKKYRVGDKHSEYYTFTKKKVIQFAEVSGDKNPLHLDPVYVQHTRFKKNIVHGMFLLSIISKIIGNHFPGRGSIYVSQDVHFLKPVYVDEKIQFIVTLIERNNSIFTFSTNCMNKDNECVLIGEAKILFEV